ncbi:MAG: hypothetical protein V3U11_05295, partial [Planctomycetota bacterium]
MDRLAVLLAAEQDGVVFAAPDADGSVNTTGDEMLRLRTEGDGCDSTVGSTKAARIAALAQDQVPAGRVPHLDVTVEPSGE